VAKGKTAVLSPVEIDEVLSEGLSLEAERLINEALSERTRELYGKAWAAFENFCQDYSGRDEETGVRRRGPKSLPASPETIVEFVVDCVRNEWNPTTVGIALSAIAWKHGMAGEPLPDRAKASKALTGYKTRARKAGLRPKRATPARTYDLERLLGPVDLTSAQGLRDRAMITIGYAIAARRLVLCGLNLTDFREIRPSLFEVRIYGDKGGTDRVCMIEHWGVPKRGRCKDPLCPVCSVQAWIEHLRGLGVENGPMFRAIDRHGNVSGIRSVAGSKVVDGRLNKRAVNKIIDRMRLTAGLPPGLTPHSLRAGFATENYELGADALWIKRHGGWADNSAAFVAYIRNVDMAVNNPLNHLRAARRARV